MTRYIEIQDDNKELKQLSTDNLPFEVYSSIENGKVSLLISTADENKEEIQKNTYAYIAQDEGHLFFQPVTKEFSHKEIKIFHNDEAIEKSVWLKSGDTLQIEDKIISYQVSGDKIQFKVQKQSSQLSSQQSKPELIPPPPFSNHLDEKHIEQLTQAENQNEIIPDQNNRIQKRILIALSVILILTAGFMLFAETVRINIEPVTAETELSGLFPVLKINKNYILISGEYDLSVNKKGYQPLNKTITIDSKNKEFSFVLQEKPGVIQFNISPSKNNQIYIDNVFLGNGTAKPDNEKSTNLVRENSQYEINKGQHNLVVTNPRYKKFEQLIKVEGKNVLQQFNMELEPDWADVKITSETENTSIKIFSDLNDEEAVYENKIIHTIETELVSGHYTAILSKEKYKEKRETFTVDAGVKKNVNITKLEPADAQIKLTSEPAGSLISIDEQYMGKAPQTIQLSPYAEHQISLSLTGYKDIKTIIKLEPGEVSKQNYQLEMQKGIVFISVIPRQAQLFIDGKIQKESSGKFDLGGNNHTIIVKAAGYKTQTKKINASSYSKSISFNLKKNNKTQARTNVPVSSKKIKIKTVKDGNYTNSISQKMILIKPAEFVMGSKKNEAGRGSNEREYKVKLNKAYYLSEKEISNQQFRSFKASHNSGNTNGVSLNNNKQPVVNVTWNEAAKFANWLSKKEGLNVYYKETGKQMTAINFSGNINGYRLPYEAEWAYAARGNKQKKYPWLGNFPPQSVTGNFADESAVSYVANIIEGYNDQYAVSSPVGSYNKNAAGFYDLGGNVSEWCQDYYSPFTSSANKTLNNPTGSERGTHNVVRDSSWRDSSITELRLSYRSYSKTKAKDLGFRLARYAQ